MDSLLRPVKSVKKLQRSIDRFENLALTESTKPRSNSTKSKRSIVDLSTPIDSENTTPVFDIRPSIASSSTSASSHSIKKTHKRHDSTAFLQKSYLKKPPPSTLIDDAREILKSQPDHEDLLAVLQYLDCGVRGKHDFNIHRFGPKAAQIINILVTTIIPDHWPVLSSSNLSKHDAMTKQLLLTTFRSIAGIGAFLMQIRTLSTKTTSGALTRTTIEVLATVIKGEDTLKRLVQETQTLYTNEAQRRNAWNETVSLLAGSKILSVVAQAYSAIEADNVEALWLSQGAEHTRWLARNIVSTATSLDVAHDVSWAMLSQVMKRGLSLGYRDAYVAEIYTSLLLGGRALWTPLQTLLQKLTPQEQRTCFDLILRDLVRKYLRSTPSGMEETNDLESQKSIGGVAALVTGLIQHNRILSDHITEWLTSTTGEYANFGLDPRRALIATLALNQDRLQHILDKCLDNFGDKLQIQHSPVLQQEATTQVILLAVGALSRIDIEAVRATSKSALFIHAVSNRLGASIPRARVLGMILATAVSRLVDPADKVMNFGVEDVETEDAYRWLKLIEVDDKPSSLDDILRLDHRAGPKMRQHENAAASSTVRRRNQPVQPQVSKIIAIEEVDDDDEEGDSDQDDLPAYQKPDSDPSDSDEDPTLLNRTKPSAPVYIIDLIRQLQADDKPDVVELALKTASELIRRKASFGSELSENVQVVASALINMRESVTEPEQQQLQQKALLACLVGKPAIIGPWTASMYFEGDFALDQRATILSIIGLGAREMSGYKDSPPTQPPPPTPFPSKRLPSHLSAIYTTTTSITNQIEHSTLQPMALAAADKLSGPDILKIRTFSSRMSVQAKQAQTQSERTKRIPHNLHKLLTHSLYLPMCCRMSLILSSSSVHLGSSNIFEAHIIRLFLQSLTIVLFCIGPNALQLSECSRETFLLLTALHNIPKLACDPVVLPSLLQLLLTTMDLNIESGSAGEERLVTEYGAMVAELVSWVGELEKGHGVAVPVIAEEGGGMPWNVIVAGVQMKWYQVGRKYQGRMLGLMGGETDDF